MDGKVGNRHWTITNIIVDLLNPDLGPKLLLEVRWTCAGWAGARDIHLCGQLPLVTPSFPAPAYSSADMALTGIAKFTGSRLHCGSRTVWPGRNGCGKIFGIRFERDRILQNAQFFYNCRFAVNYGTSTWIFSRNHTGLSALLNCS